VTTGADRVATDDQADHHRGGARRLRLRRRLIRALGRRLGCRFGRRLGARRGPLLREGIDQELVERPAQGRDEIPQVGPALGFGGEAGPHDPLEGLRQARATRIRLG
jgi:hypothetical protein